MVSWYEVEGFYLSKSAIAEKKHYEVCQKYAGGVVMKTIKNMLMVKNCPLIGEKKKVSGKLATFTGYYLRFYDAAGEWVLLDWDTSFSHSISYGYKVNNYAQLENFMIGILENPDVATCIIEAVFKSKGKRYKLPDMLTLKVVNGKWAFDDSSLVKVKGSY